MAKQTISIGSSANDGTGSTLRAGGDLINDNFNEIYNKVGDGTNLTSDTITLNTATQTLTNKTLTSPDINTSIELLARAEARFQDASGGQYVGLEAPATVSSSFVLTLPDADGSSGQFLRTDGSGALSFATVSTTTAFDDVTAGDAAVNVTTTAGNIVIDAQGNDTDIILKGTDGGSDTTFLTIDGSEAGAAAFNSTVSATAFTSTGASTFDGVNITEDGTIVFEGATDNTYETTLTVTDPTQDRTVTLPNATGTVQLQETSVDVNGNDLVLDADGDTKIVESADDVLQLSFAGVTGSPTEFGAGYISLKNQGSQSYIRFYCESSNAHYVQVQAPAHADFSGNHTVTFPNYTGTLVAGAPTSSKATGDGSTVAFTITSNRAVNDVLVFVNGICLVPTDDYTISGTTLTFQTAPVNSAEITFRFLPK